MSELKTQETDASVAEFLATVEHDRRRQDAQYIVAMMERITGHAPRMWGNSIIGFDAYDYTYSSGRVGRWPMVGLSPRKANLSIYIMPGFEKFRDELAALGPHKSSVSCLYITDLRKVNVDVLEGIVARSYDMMRAKYSSPS